MKRKVKAAAAPALEPPCKRCLVLAQDGRLRMETVQPLPKGALAPLARDGSGSCCFDCAAADGLVRFMGLEFAAARIAVGNERQEQLRFPGAPLGLVGGGLVRASAKGDYERHHAWLDAHGWFGGPEADS